MIKLSRKRLAVVWNRWLASAAGRYRICLVLSGNNGTLALNRTAIRVNKYIGMETNYNSICLEPDVYFDAI